MAPARAGIQRRNPALTGRRCAAYMARPMATHDIQRLNGQFGVPGHLEFRSIQGGLPAAVIRNRHASATVALHGGHVTAFQPHGQDPVLWMSRCSRFQTGAPIRGGIPICWPWFGAHPTRAQAPFHGFARVSEWDVARAQALDDGSTLIELGLADTPQSRELWPHPFGLRLRVRVSTELDVELTMLNTGHEPMTCSAALHSYFAVSEVASIRVRGLEGTPFMDTVQSVPVPGVEDQPLVIRSETDRIYLDTESRCSIDDPGLRRCIRIAKRGSRSTVVWNPWIAKSARMPDFGDDEFHRMLCIETANAAADAREIASGETHVLDTVISVEPLST